METAVAEENWAGSGDGQARQEFVAADGSSGVEVVGVIPGPIACEVIVGVGVLSLDIGMQQQVAWMV